MQGSTGTMTPRMVNSCEVCDETFCSRDCERSTMVHFASVNKESCVSDSGASFLMCAIVHTSRISFSIFSCFLFPFLSNDLFVLVVSQYFLHLLSFFENPCLVCLFHLVMFLFTGS